MRIAGTSAVTISRSQISGNTAQEDGAAFLILDNGTASTISLTETTVADNISTYMPAVILRMDAAGSSASIKQSTFSGNQGTDIAAIEMGRANSEAGDGSLSIVNSTFSGNTATTVVDVPAAGVVLGPYASTTVEHSTFIDNGTDGADSVQVLAATKTGEAGGAVFNLYRSVFTSGNADDIRYGSSPYGASAYLMTANRSSNILANGEAVEANVTLTGVAPTEIDPGVGALEDNGGYTFTHAPVSATSALVESGSEGSRPDGDVDQRGVGRVGVNTDLGAVEHTGNRAPELTGNLAARLSGLPGRSLGTLDLRALFTDPDGDGVDVVSVQGLPPGVTFNDGADTLTGQLGAEGQFLVTIEVQDDVAAPETLTRVVRAVGVVDGSPPQRSSSGGVVGGLMLGLLALLGLRRRP